MITECYTLLLRPHLSPGAVQLKLEKTCTHLLYIMSDLILISFYIGPVSEDVGCCPYPGDGCSGRTAQSGRVSYREHEAVHPEALQALH